MTKNQSVVLFYSTSAAIKAERLSQKASLTVRLITVPRHLSSDCGICLRFENKDLEAIRAILSREKVEYDGIHQL